MTGEMRLEAENMGRRCLWIQPSANNRAIWNPLEKNLPTSAQVGSIIMNLKAPWEMSDKMTETKTAAVILAKLTRRQLLGPGLEN